MLKEIIDMSELLVVALTLYGESGNQPFAGKYLVAETIANRAAQEKTTCKDACLRPKQYSCWNGLKNQKRMIALTTQYSVTGSEAWRDCIGLARMICASYTPTSPVTHYYAPRLCKKPAWAKKMKLMASVEDHRFYAKKEKK